MTTYIFFDTALQMIVSSYLISTVVLIAASAIGIAVIETMEKASHH